jgi:glycosyltransferase involved in cell wall biosynthesis
MTTGARGSKMPIKDPTAMQQINFFCMSSTMGGGELFTLELARAMPTSIECSIVARPDSPVMRAAQSAGVQVKTLDIGQKLGRRTGLTNLVRWPVYDRRFRRFIAEHDGAWHILQYKWEQILWGGSTQHNIAMLEHGPIPRDILRVPVLNQRLIKALTTATRVFAVSAQAQRSIRTALPTLAVDMLHGGVNLEAIQTALSQRDTVRKRFGLTADAYVLAFCGRVVNNKGIFDAIRLVSQSSSGHLLVIGDGPDLANARTFAAQSGAEDRIIFVGHTSSPLEYVAASDCLILLSKDPGEGRPLSALEGWSLGKPVLGLEASQALCDLADEPGAPLMLLDDLEHGGLDGLIDNLRGLSADCVPYERSWENVAADLLTYLNHHPPKNNSPPSQARYQR